MNYTDITVRISTNESTALTDAVWTGSTHARGSLVVTYRSGGTYVFTGVSMREAITLLEAAESGHSLGSALHHTVKSRDTVKVS